MEKQKLSQAQISKAKRRLQKLMKNVEEVGPMMRGSIVTNGRKHRQPYFSLNRDKRTHLIYLGEGRVKVAKKLSANYKRMLKIIEEMTIINMLLLKNDAL